MRAARVITLDGPDGVVVGDVGPDPTGKDGEVVVEVHAVGVGFPDLLMSQGRYQVQPDLPYVLGVDFAGVVRADRSGSGLVAGDRVAGWSTYGSAAEVVSVPADRVFPLPDSLSFAQGASMPLNYLTAHLAVVHRSGLRSGDTLLVTGAAGGVGSAAVRIATALGIRVVAVVTSEAEAAYAVGAGAVEAITELTADRVRAVAAGGVAAVLDVVGSDQVVLESLRSLAVGGRLLSLGYVAGDVPAVKLNRLLLNNLDVCGVAWGPWTRARPGFAEQQWRELCALVAVGALVPAEPSRRGLDDAADALTALAERRSLGKTVLMVRR